MVKKVFLTPDDGILPRDNNWVPISFKTLVKTFLGVWRQLRNKPGYQVFRLYVAGVLKSLLEVPIGNGSHDENRFNLLYFLSDKKHTLKGPLMPADTCRALGFFMTYLDEMNEQHDQHTKPIEERGRNKNDRKKDAVEYVYDCAGKQGAKFLLDLAESMRNHFKNICGCHAKIRQQLRTVEKDWEVEVKIWPKRMHSRSSRCSGGFNLTRIDDRPRLVCWLWGTGGSAAEDDLKRVFGDKVRERDDGWNAGCVFLGDPIKIGISKKYDVDLVSLSEKAENCIKQIDKRKVQRWLATTR